MEIKLSFVILCDVILRKSGHIRGAKRLSLSEVPYRQAFENMNEAVHINKASMHFLGILLKISAVMPSFSLCVQMLLFFGNTITDNNLESEKRLPKYVRLP